LSNRETEPESLIIELTPEQKAQLVIYRNKWIEIGLCTEPANRPKAEEGINLAYECAGLEPPKEIIWCESPLSATLIAFRNYTRRPVEKFVRSDAWQLAGKLIMKSVDKFLLQRIGMSVWNPVWKKVEISVGNFIMKSIYNVHDSVRHIAGEFCLGQHDAPWLSYYEHLRKELGLYKETEGLQGLLIQAQHAGWFLPYEDVCFVSERPNFIKLDDDGHLHCEDGPAIEYPDGFKVYALHGERQDKGALKCQNN